MAPMDFARQSAWVMARFPMAMKAALTRRTPKDSLRSSKTMWDLRDHGQDGRATVFHQKTGSDKPRPPPITPQEWRVAFRPCLHRARPGGAKIVSSPAAHTLPSFPRPGPSVHTRPGRGGSLFVSRILPNPIFRSTGSSPVGDVVDLYACLESDPLFHWPHTSVARTSFTPPPGGAGGDGIQLMVHT